MSGIVEIHGKQYKTVACRVNEFRQSELYSGFSIQTEIISTDADHVVMTAKIIDGDNRLIATGHAEEKRGSSSINKTSALENCETSAIGRALANIGLAGEEFASADEVANAISQQKQQEIIEWIVKHNNCVRMHLNSIMMIKDYISAGNLSAACEAWEEMGHDVHKILWVAPSKGGIFTTDERSTIKSDEFKKAYYGEES